MTTIINPCRIYKYVQNGNQALINRNSDMPQVRGIFLYDEDREPDFGDEQKKVAIFEESGTTDIVLRTGLYGDKTVTDFLTRVERPDRFKSWWWNAQAGSVFAVGTAAPTVAGNGTADNDNTTSWTKFTSDGVTAPAGVMSASNIVRGFHNPLFTTVVRTPSDLTDLTFWVGLMSAAPTNDSGATHHVGFRYSSALDAGWVMSTRGGGAQTISWMPAILPQGSPAPRLRTIAANTVYTFTFAIDSAAGNVVAQIDGGVEEWDNSVGLWTFRPGRKITVTATLPSMSQDLSAVVRVLSTASLLDSKSISLSRLFVQHK